MGEGKKVILGGRRRGYEYRVEVRKVVWGALGPLGMTREAMHDGTVGSS